MPLFLTAVACHSVAVDPLTNAWSFLGVIDALRPIAKGEDAVDDDPDAPLEPGFLIPPFRLVTIWWRQTDDEGKEFEQGYFLVNPDTVHIQITSTNRLTMSSFYHRVLELTPPLELHKSGLYVLLLKIRPVGQEDWEDVWHYPLIFQAPMAVNGMGRDAPLDQPY